MDHSRERWLRGLRCLDEASQETLVLGLLVQAGMRLCWVWRSRPFSTEPAARKRSASGLAAHVVLLTPLGRWWGKPAMVAASPSEISHG